MNLFTQWAPYMVVVVTSGGMLWAVAKYFHETKHEIFVNTICTIIFLFIVFIFGTKFYYLSGLFQPYPVSSIIY